MNPVLLQVIRQAYYSSTTSIARRVYHIFAIYPSLLKDLVVAGFTWTGIIPINAFIMGAIAVSAFKFAVSHSLIFFSYLD